MKDEPTTEEAASASVGTSFCQMLHQHQSWAKKVLQLAALESKIWLTSSVQLLALMCGMLLLLTSAWLMLLATFAVLLWQLGVPLIGVMLLGVAALLFSSLLLYRFISQTLKRMNFTRTLDALIDEAME